jgi:hypothetical protein
MCIGSERYLEERVTGDPGKGSKTGILKSIVFHKIPTAEFDFAAISVTVHDRALLRCL